MAVDINITSIRTQTISANNITINNQELATKADLSSVGLRTYTINGVEPDENGNFELTPGGINAATVDHNHTISEIDGLQTALDSKSASSHTHDYVTSLKVNGAELSGVVELKAGSGVNMIKSGNSLTLISAPYDFANASSITDSSSSSKEIKMFIGTQAEWDAMSKDSAYKYIVFIKD